jgi:hypothetical protein
LKAGEADFKVYCSTVGSTVSKLSRSWNLPDKWIYERNKVKEKDHILSFLRNAMSVALAVLALFWAVGILKSGMIRWRIPIALGALSGTIVLLTQLNTLPVAMYGYSNDVQLTTFMIKELVDNVIAIVSAAAWMGLSAAFALAAYRYQFPNVPLSSMLKAASPWHCEDEAAMRRMWLDGITAGYCVSCTIYGISYLFDVAQFQMSPSVHMLSLSAIRSMGDEWNPALGALLGSVSTSISALLAAACGASFVIRFFKGSFWKTFALVLVCAMISMGSERYWQDYIWNVSQTVVCLSLAYLCVRRIIKFNFIGYLAAGFAVSIGGSLYGMMRQAMPMYAPYAAILMLALVSPALFTGWLYLRSLLGIRRVVPAAVPAIVTQSSDDSASGPL